MAYVDGFVIPVPADKKDEYYKVAAAAAGLFRGYGALQIVECWGNDVPEGKVTDFRRAVAAEAVENVVFSWIVWPSKEVRDAANAKMHEDPAFAAIGECPFDPKRLIFGGFEVILDTNAPATAA